MQVELSLVVTTLGRSQQLGRLMASIERQVFRDFELIVVDQNQDDRILEAIASRDWSFPVQHLRRPGMRGATRGRNEGWHNAVGRTLLFPDDDCWYPPDFLKKGMALLDETGAAFVCGRPADESGRDINGRFAHERYEVTRERVWTSAIEWTMFIRRSCLETIGGYNEDIGVGAPSPWQACEAQEFMLRALAAGLRGYYDPTLVGHHEELDIYTPDEAMIRKGRAYARGMGYVLRSCGFSPLSAAYWCARPMANVVTAFLRGDASRLRYFAGVSAGRLEGYTRHLFTS